MLSVILAAVHLVSLALGVAVLMLRARALASANKSDELGPVFFWDNLAGLIAIAWIGSGVWRAFGGLEKGTDYYLSNHAFWGKMTLLGVVLALECVPMVTFIRWRTRIGRGEAVSLARKRALVRVHWAEFWLMCGIIVFATLMARGVGVVPARSAAETDEAAEPARRGVSGAALTAGPALYRTHCLACHQADGRGFGGRLAADFVGDPTRLAKSDDALVRSILDGVPNTAMRGFRAELQESEARELVAYLRQSFAAR